MSVPLRLVAPSVAVEALNVRLTLFSGCRLCEPDAEINNGKQVVSAASFTDWIVWGTMLVEPSKVTPPIVLPVCSVVAVVAFPDRAPVNVVVDRLFVLLLNVSVVFVLPGSVCVPEAVTNTGKHVVSVVSVAVPMFVALVAVVAVVALPDKAPVNVVAPRLFVLESYVKPVFVLAGNVCEPDAVTNVKKQVVSAASLAVPMFVALVAVVAVVALPLKAPVKVVQARFTVLALNVSEAFDFAALLPVAEFANSGKQVVSAASLATVNESTVHTVPEEETVTSPLSPSETPGELVQVIAVEPPP